MQNIQTWARLVRLELQTLSVALGNATLRERKNWPTNGEGRLVKATTEKILRSLDSAFERGDLNFIFDIIEEAIANMQSISEIPFYNAFLAQKKYHIRNGQSQTFDSVIKEILPAYTIHIERNRPSKTKNIPLPTVQLEYDSKIDELIPAQKSAPIKFSVTNGKLYIKKQRARVSAEDRQMLSYGTSALKSDANSIILSLAETNTDPRFLVAFEEIRDVLASDSDIIRVGMLSISCSSLVRRFHEQLPDIVGAKLEAFETNLSMFVGQFQDWQKFVANASASEEVTTHDVEVIFDVGNKLVDQLKADQELVDPQVPRSLQILLEAIRDPKTSSKRAIFGIVRTLENLIGTIILGFGGFFGAAFSGLKDGLRASSKLATIALLMTMTGQYAATLSPSVSKIIKSDWLEKAAKIIKEAFEA